MDKNKLEKVLACKLALEDLALELLPLGSAQAKKLQREWLQTLHTVTGEWLENQPGNPAQAKGPTKINID